MPRKLTDALAQLRTAVDVLGRHLMGRTRYILTTAAAYVATFVAVSLILRSWPPYPAYQTGLMMVVGALVFAWVGTERTQQMVGADETEFTAASIFHALLIAVLLVGSGYVRFRTTT